jgi:hypothetical protein
MPDYTFTKSFDIVQRTRAAELLKWGARENWSTNDLQTRLKREGLGYRRENMVKDFEFARVVSMSKTPEAEKRATDFYKNVYQPFKADFGLNTSQMGTVMRAWRGEIDVPDELIEAVDQYGAYVEESGS